MTDLDKKIDAVLADYADYVYYEGDPLRGGISRLEAIEKIKGIVREATDEFLTLGNLYRKA